jgi:hypothetical protein
MGLGRKHPKVRGGGGARGSGLLNSEKRRICMSNNVVAATGWLGWQTDAALTGGSDGGNVKI